MEQTFYALADLSAASVAGISGAQAAREHGLDLFGVYTMAYVTACTGGIFRDLAIGALPPVGLADWRYLACALLAGTLAVWGGARLDRLRNSVLFFDALGLGFYSVIGAQKALSYHANAATAVLLGVATAVGGGVARDVLLNRVPAILQTEIYATAALVGASIQILGRFMGWSLFRHALVRGLDRHRHPAARAALRLAPAHGPAGAGRSIGMSRLSRDSGCRERSPSARYS